MKVLFLFVLFAAVQVVADDFRPEQSNLPVNPPEGAIVLFGGDGQSLFVGMDGASMTWPIEQEELVSSKAKKPRPPRSNHILSRIHFRDADIHVEFMLPESGSGNSGIYIHGHYELQIIDSYRKAKVSQQDAGAVYGFGAPKVNACRPRGEWQVYDIRYHAPRRNSDGVITSEGSITAWLNGQLVQEDLTVGEPKSSYHPFRYGRTEYLSAIEDRLLMDSTGPVFLQDHDNPVRFRNVWLRPLDEEVFEYKLGK